MKRRNGLTWREKERARTRKQILTAARKVFSSKGLHEASLSLIASEAGMGKATLYSYFANKADLVSAVLEDAVEQHLRSVRRAISSEPDVRSMIRIIAVEHLKQFAKHRYFLRMFDAEDMFRSREMRRKIRGLMMRNYSRHTKMLEETFALAAEKGLIVKADPGKVAHVFLAVLHAVSLYWHIRGVKPAPEQEGRMICDVLFDGLGRA
ncbi:MAG: TetR/AcrR family transcriptional regulator [Candidatus Eisenbacteria bacterium]|nr:TetR/AcrR family transcriptional regulator [Candidatus Eisenbacteria bacterium]